MSASKIERIRALVKTGEEVDSWQDLMHLLAPEYHTNHAVYSMVNRLRESQHVDGNVTPLGTALGIIVFLAEDNRNLLEKLARDASIPTAIKFIENINVGPFACQIMSHGTWVNMMAEQTVFDSKQDAERTVAKAFPEPAKSVWRIVDVSSGAVVKRGVIPRGPNG